MASLDDIPVAAARDLVRKVIDKCRMHDGTRPAEAIVFLAIEEARIFWWVIKWLEVIREGPTQFTLYSIDDCKQMITTKIGVMKSQGGDEKALYLNKDEIMTLIDAEQHLDNFALQREFDAVNKGSGHRYRNGVRKK